MTLNEAVKRGISRLRIAKWRNPHAYMKIDLIGNTRGPWGRLYDRKTQEIIEEPTPQSWFLLGEDSDEWEEYKGPLDEADS